MKEDSLIGYVTVDPAGAIDITLPTFPKEWYVTYISSLEEEIAKIEQELGL